jgi:hypothetical protein
MASKSSIFFCWNKNGLGNFFETNILTMLIMPGVAGKKINLIGDNYFSKVCVLFLILLYI